MVIKHKQKKKKNFKSYGKSNKEKNALIDKIFQVFAKNKKRRKQSSSNFKKYRFPMMKSKRESPA